MKRSLTQVQRSNKGDWHPFVTFRGGELHNAKRRHTNQKEWEDEEWEVKKVIHNISTGVWTACPTTLATSRVLVCGLIARGDDSFQRTGDTVLALEAYLSASFNIIAGADVVKNAYGVFIALALDRQCNGTAYSPTTHLFTDVTATQTWENTDINQRYSLLWYKKFVMPLGNLIAHVNPTTEVVTRERDGSQRHYETTVPLEFFVNYKDGSALETSINDNNLVVLIFADNAAVRFHLSCEISYIG